MSLKIYITILKRKTSLDVILKHKTPSSFSGLITARAEINSTRALPVIARAWLRHCLDSTQIQRLQLIQNSLARAVTRTPRHHHITPVLKSLHWLKIPERIHFKVLSLTYNSL